MGFDFLRVLPYRCSRFHSSFLWHDFAGDNSNERKSSPIHLKFSHDGSEDTLKTQNIKKKPQDEQVNSTDSPSHVLEVIDDVVELAAASMLQRTLGFISSDSEILEKGNQDIKTSSLSKQGTRSKTSTSVFGMLSGVGKLVEDFAVSLDNAIGNVIDEWSTPDKVLGDSRKHEDSVLSERGQRSSSPDREIISNAKNEKQSPWKTSNAKWSAFDESFDSMQTKNEKASFEDKDSWLISTIRSNDSRRVIKPEEAKQWRRRAQVMQKELFRLRAQKEEWTKVQKEYEALKRSMEEPQSSQESESKSLLTESSLDRNDVRQSSVVDKDMNGSQYSAKVHERYASLDEDQITGQLEILLAEKARLAEENSRLRRENASLSELLDLATSVVISDPEEDCDTVSDDDGNYLYDSHQSVEQARDILV